MAVVSRKPIKKPGLPPILGGTPNPLANVNPEPALNRNTALPKTGAVLPFPNPNQPLVDLATPPILEPGVPTVVGGVTAGLAGGLPPRLTPLGEAPGPVAVPTGTPEPPPIPPENEFATYTDLQLERWLQAISDVEGPEADARRQQLQAEQARRFKAKGGRGTLPPPGGSDLYAPGAEGDERIIGGRPHRFTNGKWTPFTPSEPPTKPEEMDPDLKALLDRHLLTGEIGPQLLNQLLLGFDTRGKASPNELRRQAEAYIATYKRSTKGGGKETQKRIGKLEEILKATGLDTLGVTVPELNKFSPDQIFTLYNRSDFKMTDVQVRTLLENWQSQNPGQKVPIPTDTASRAYQLYRTLEAVGKAGTIFAAAAAGTAGAVTPQQIADYMGQLNTSAVLPKDADEAYRWLQQPLEPPPGLTQTDQGWANADGSPPTPEQRAALNKYIGLLNTQDRDREVAYGLIATRDGEAAARRVREQNRASGATPALMDATGQYRQQLKGFSRVPTTLAEATTWLAQTLTPPPGLTFDETTKQWVDEGGRLPTFDRAQAVQDYEFQVSQYAENRKKADGIIQSYADTDAAQRAADAADAALRKALGTTDIMEQVELTYRKEQADLAFKEAQTKHQKVVTFVELTNNPAMAARLKALGLLDQFNKDTGMDIKVPDRVDRNKVFGMIPSLGDWSKMNPQQQLDAMEMLSAKTGWMPEELAALMSETAGAPGGGRSGGVSESTVKRQ